MLLPEVELPAPVYFSCFALFVFTSPDPPPPRRNPLFPGWAELKWYKLEHRHPGRKVNGRLLLGVRLVMTERTSAWAAEGGFVENLKTIAEVRKGISRREPALRDHREARVHAPPRARLLLAVREYLLLALGEGEVEPSRVVFWGRRQAPLSSKKVRVLLVAGPSRRTMPRPPPPPVSFVPSHFLLSGRAGFEYGRRRIQRYGSWGYVFFFFLCFVLCSSVVFNHRGDEVSRVDHQVECGVRIALLVGRSRDLRTMRRTLDAKFSGTSLPLLPSG